MGVFESLAPMDGFVEIVGTLGATSVGVALIGVRRDVVGGVEVVLVLVAMETGL